MRTQASPFIVTGPAPAQEVVGRHDVLAALADWAARGRFVLLTAPRRYGKTTLVRRLAADTEGSRELAVVIVDLLGVQTLDDVAVRMGHAWSRLPAGALAKAAAKVLPFVSGLDVAGGVVNVALRPPAASDARALEAVLDVPRAVAERLDRRVLVVLDEFQAIAEVERADAIIRSQIQHHAESVSYLFAGSDQSVTEMLFADRSRPLYGQAERFHLGPFDPDALAAYVEARLADSGRSITPAALRRYLELTGGHPQRAMLVADAAWATVDDGATIDLAELAGAVEEALERCREEFSSTVGFLTDAQARVARLAAWGEPMTGAAAGRLRLSSGSARAAAAALLERGVLARTERRHAHVDPLLAEWFRRIGPRP
jgi:hypothetical protein